MKKLLLAILFVFALVGCDSDEPKKITADVLVGVLTPTIVTSLDCEASDVVKADVQAKMYEWFKINQERGIMKDLCKTAITGIIPQLISTTIPATWQCKQTKLENAAEVLAACAGCCCGCALEAGSQPIPSPAPPSSRLTPDKPLPV